MSTKEYEDGKLASRFLENGTGFVYYPNGSVAVCISEASNYQNRYFAFDKDRKNTLLLSLDEHSVGFMSGSKRKQLKGTTPECALTKIGGIITNSEGRIINQWKWDLKAQNSGNPPSEAVIFRLNEHLTCIFKNRFEVSLTFEYDAIKFEFDIGMKFKRNDTYLDNVKKTLDGRLIPQIQHTTLRERQIEFGKEMQNQRNKLHPRSENLSNMVQNIVGNLEQNFDNFGETLKLPPVELSTIKNEALQKTLNEIPRIESTGMETGIYAGFSKDIYVDKGERVNLSKTAPAKLFNDKGQWKDSLSIRTTLREENPPLSRKTAILKASGRYSDMLVVDPQAVTSDNPTGMVEIRGLPLQHVRWEQLKSSLINEDPKLLTVVLVLRAGDPICCSYLRIAEIVHLKYQKYRSELNSHNNTTNTNSTNLNSTNNTNNTNNTSRPPSAINSSSATYNISSRPPKMYQIDVSESSNVIKELGIKSLPIFLIYQGSNLVYAGSIGGRNVKLDTTVHKPQVMLVESNFRDQITCEKTLRKLGCEPFLCLTINEAVNRIQQFSNPLPNSSGHTPDPVIFDLILISEDVPGGDLMNLRRVLKDVTQDSSSSSNNRHNNSNNNGSNNNNSGGRTIVAMLINVLGEFGRSNLNAVHWESGCTNDVTAFSRRDLANVCSAAIQKPIKQIAIEKLLSMRQLSHVDSNFGLTPETLERKISQVFQEALNGQCRRIDYVGIRMSAQDTKLRNGRELVS